MGDGCHKYALTLPYWPNMTQHDAIFNTGVADSTSSKQITGWIIHFTTLLGLFPSIIPIGSRREVAWIYPEIWEVPKMGYPQSSSILIGFSLLNHLGYPHDYGNQGKYDHCHPGLLAGGHCTAGADHSHSWSCECTSKHPIVDKPYKPIFDCTCIAQINLVPTNTNESWAPKTAARLAAHNCNTNIPVKITGSRSKNLFVGTIQNSHLRWFTKTKSDQELNLYKN